MANQKLNEVTTVPTASINNVKTFLAVMNDGSIQQMSKDDMATVLGGLLPTVKPTKNGLMPYTLYSGKNYRTGVIKQEDGNRLKITSKFTSSFEKLVGGIELKYALVKQRNNTTPWMVPTGTIYAYPGGTTGNMVHNSCNHAYAPTVSFKIDTVNYGDFILTIDFTGDFYYECSTYYEQVFEISKV